MPRWALDRLTEIHDGVILAFDASERTTYTRDEAKARGHMRSVLRQTLRLIREVAAGLTPAFSRT